MNRANSISSTRHSSSRLRLGPALLLTCKVASPSSSCLYPCPPNLRPHPFPVPWLIGGGWHLLWQMALGSSGNPAASQVFVGESHLGFIATWNRKKLD